jgi:transposase
MAAGPQGEEHSCEWRSRAEGLEREVADLRGRAERAEAQVTTLTNIVGKMQHDMAALTRRLLGPKSEKLPPITQELRENASVDLEAVLKKRRERQQAKAELAKETVHYPVPEAQRRCPKCGSDQLRPLGEGKATTLYDYRPPRFVVRQEVRETLSCRCGEGIITAEGPVHWQEKSRYSAAFVAHVITAKCADSLPLHRLEKGFQRLGVPMARSTMTDMFHASAELLRPLSERLLALVREAPVVHADETSLKVQAKDKCRTGFVWNFRTTEPRPLIAYRFSPSRSGETPKQILGGTTGALVVDGYTGYNAVTDVNGRERVACHAHVRRYFFDALPTAPEARRALNLILELYRVEHAAFEARIVGTPRHLALRKERSTPVRAELKAWLDQMQGQHPPKSPLGTAIRYTLNHWEMLGRFVEDARIPLDNNPAEAALRRVALGRKNFLFVGNDRAGENLAGLYSLVATCEANGVNPLAYLADVIIRIHEHPNSRIDELLPHHWRGPPDESASAA